jgi:putative toxin-antitoxin system antitoxin component (TIGR02293 family)
MSTFTLVALLGGAHVLGAKPKSARQWHQVISQGVPVRSAEVLKDSMEVSDSLLAELLGISEKTLSRARKANTSLDAVTSDRLFRVARIAALACKSLESDKAALAWLKRPQTGLGGQTPVSLLTTSAGAEEVERLLLRIEYGVYS